MSSRSSSSSCSSRRVHLWGAWITAMPLLVTVCSGMAYRISRTLGADKQAVRWMLRVHTLEIVGLRSYFPLLLLCLVSTLLLTGFSMTSIWGWFCRNCCCGCGPRPRSSSSDSANRSLNHAVEQYERAQYAAAAASGGAQKGLLSGGAHGVSISEVHAAAGTDPAGDESEWSDSESGAARGRSGSDALGGGDDADADFLRRRVAPHLTPRWTWQQRLHSWFPARFTWRWLHRTLGTAVLLPLSLTAFTGASWVWAADWMYLEKPQYALLMYLHEGRYIEGSGTIYVTILGTASVALILAGINLLLTRGGGWNKGGQQNSSATAPPRYITAPIVHASSSSASASSSLPHVASDAEAASSSSSAFLSPSSLETRRTMARIHKAFDVDPSTTSAGEETEDELAGMHSPPTGK